MPQQPDSAIPKTISAINANSDLIGKKMRVVGRMLSYDSITAVVLLQDEESAVLVDVSLCIEAKTSGEWVRERKGLVTVIGHLESSSIPLPIPDLPSYAPAPEIDPSVVLRALLVLPMAPDFDIKLWRDMITQDEEDGVPDYSQIL